MLLGMAGPWLLASSAFSFSFSFPASISHRDVLLAIAAVVFGLIIVGTCFAIDFDLVYLIAAETFASSLDLKIYSATGGRTVNTSKHKLGIGMG
jgi:hypothetical protein